MLKVSFSIIASIFVCLIVKKAQLLTSNNSITIKFTIFSSLLIGVLIAYHSNKSNLTFYQTCKQQTRIKIKLFTFILFGYLVYYFRTLYIINFNNPYMLTIYLTVSLFLPIILILFYFWIRFWDKVETQ